MKQLLIIFFVVYGQWSFAQGNKKVLKQIKGLDTSCEELRPLMSLDGEYLYFSRHLCNGQRSQEIWEMELNDSNGNRTMKLVKGLNNKENNSVVGISTNPHEIFVMDVYPADRFGRPTGIRRAFREDDGQWKLGKSLLDFKEVFGKKKTRGYLGVFVHPSGQAIFLTLENKQKKLDLYVTYKDEIGMWSFPINLGPHINTNGNEFGVFLSENGKMLYFSTDGHEGMGGVDIYRCQRLGSWEEWSIPVNIGLPYNSSSFDGYYSKNGEQEFFVSDRMGGMSDIFHALIDTEKSELVSQNIDSISSPSANGTFPSIVPISLYFNRKDDRLSKYHLARLTQHIQKIDPKTYEVYVVGYADKEGDEVFNTALSTTRAERVANILQAKGFTIKQVYGKGSYQKSRNKTEMNNRVEVKFYSF